MISGRQGAADTRFLNIYGDTPTVIFGPGSTAVMHADDEYVSIDDYMTAIKVMALASTTGATRSRSGEAREARITRG